MAAPLALAMLGCVPSCGFGRNAAARTSSARALPAQLDLSRAAAHTPGISALASVPVHAEVLRKLRLAVPHLDDRGELRRWANSSRHTPSCSAFAPPAEFPEAHIVDAPLPKLQSLDLGGSSAVDGSTVQSLVAGTRVLRRLNLGGVVQLTDSDLARIIPAAQNLRFLSLRDVRLMTDASLRLIAQAAPSLLELNLTGCYNISAAAVAELLACSRQRLRHLHLRGTKACTGQVLVALAAHAPQLLELDVSSDDVMLGSEEVKDEHIAALVGGCGGLQSLAVQGQVALSDAKFAAAVSTLRGLRHLDVSGADGLGRHTVQAVAFSCPELRSLRLNATAATDASIASLSSCRRLEVLDVAQCDGVSVRAVAALADATPSLSHVLAGGCQGSHLSHDAIHEHFKKRSVVFGHPDAGYAGRAAAGGGKAPGTLFVELV